MSAASKSIDISPDELRNLARILRGAGAEAGTPLWNPAPGENEARAAFAHGWRSCCEAMERIADAQPPLGGDEQARKGLT